MTEKITQQSTLKHQMSQLERLRLIGASFIVASLSVALPFFNNLATSLQSQNLYIGYAFVKGQAPYIDLVTTGGFLYHALSGLANHFGGSNWLIPLQALCFYLSGTYLHKISLYLTQKVTLAHTNLTIFYLLNIALGFGGLYPIQFATPFVFMGIWFLLTYFEGVRQDEVFILYGLVQSLALFLEPKTLIFWLLAFLVLTISNWKRSLLGRGFYQTLSMIFGSLLISYSLGYLILNMQLLLPYLQQTISYNFSQLQFNSQGNWLGAIVLSLVFISSGLAPVLASFSSSNQEENFKNIQTLLKVNSLIYLFLVILSRNSDFYDYLMILPFFLPLTALWLKNKQTNSGEGASTRRQIRQRSNYLKQYLKSSFYLPLLLLVVGLSKPLLTYLTEMPQHQDRTIIANHLSELTQPNEKIYVWDYSAKIYLETETLSSTHFVLPTINTTSKAHQNLLTDELFQFQATYIVINPALPLFQNLDANFLTHYEQVPIKGLSTLKLYQLND